MIRNAALALTVLALLTACATAPTNKPALSSIQPAASVTTTPAPPQPVITAKDFVGEYTGTCQRLMDRAMGNFHLSLRNGKGGKINGTARHVSGDPVIAKYGPINFGKGRLEADALVMENQGVKRTYFSRTPDGGVYFQYSTSAGTAMTCQASPAAVAPSASPK